MSGGSAYRLVANVRLGQLLADELVLPLLGLGLGADGVAGDERHGGGGAGLEEGVSLRPEVEQVSESLSNRE